MILNQINKFEIMFRMFRRIANNKSVQKIMWFSLDPVLYNGGEVL